MTNEKGEREESSKVTREIKIIRIICYSILLTVVLASLLLSTSVLAQEETIELKPIYPRVESATPEATFVFPVSLIYRGGHVRDFDLKVSGPSDWSTYVTSSDENIRISTIRLESDKDIPEQIKVIATPTPSAVPEPGDYTIILVISSGPVRGSIELTAVVTPTYSLDLNRSYGFSYKMATEKDNRFFITIKNTGSGHLTNIKFSAKKPQGWVVEFEPDSIERLAIGIQQEVGVNIRPASKATTATGSHRLILVAEAEQVRKEMPIYIHIEESKELWMWVGGGIGVLVVCVFILIFEKSSRKKEITE